MNDCSKPWNLRNLIEKIFCSVKEDNQHLVIDDDFLKTYIRSIVSEMVDSKLISLIDIKQESEQLLLVTCCQVYLKPCRSVRLHLFKIENKVNKSKIKKFKQLIN